MAKWRGKSYPRGTLPYVYNRQYREHDPCNNCLLPDRLAYAKYLFTKDLKGHFGCVNAIEFSPNGGEWIASGGDDRRVLIWNVEKTCANVGQPAVMTAQHHSNIFCLAFNSTISKVLSGGNDQQVIVHDIATGAILDVFLHDEAVYGLSINPANDDVFASACDDGQILIHDMRLSSSEDPLCLASYASPMHSVMYNPVDPRLVLTANSKEGIGLWDIRKPRSCLLRYGGSLAQQSCMSVRVSQLGDKVIALRRRLPPVLYNIHSPLPVVQFDTASYYNSCTMKSCCFAGDRDQYILSGSDDFNLCMWRIPDKASTAWVGEAHLVLKGHRSIVNQVRFNPSNHLMISSGVEKVIKIWSPVPISPCQDEDGYAVDGSQNQPKTERPLYTPEEYINLVLRSGQVMSHDYTQESTEEDPRMLAFFDSLVQREIDGWSSEDSLESSPERFHRFVRTDNSDSSDGSHSDIEDGFSPFTSAFRNAMATEMRNAISDGATVVLPSAAGDSAANISSSPAMNPEISAQPAVNPAPSVLQPVRGSSAMETAAVPKRRSIASLIANKRKEYLSNIVKVERTSKQKRKKKFGTVVIKGGAVLPRVGCSDSDSSGSEQNAACSDSSSSSSSSNCSGRKILLEVMEERRRANRGMQKISRLRSRIIDSDSDSSSSRIKHVKLSDNDHVSVHAQDGCHSPSEPVPSTSGCGEPSTSVLVTSLSSDQEGCTVPESLSLETSSNSTGMGSCHMPRTVSNGTSHRHVGGLDKPDVTVPKTETSNNSGYCSDLPSSQLTADNLCVAPTSSNGATNGSNSNHQEAQHTTWMEFRRFRNKVEKARRHYRQRAEQEQQASSDENS